MTDLEFMNAFLDQTLPRAQWTHEAHLRFAWLILQQFEFEIACSYAREKINQYNSKVGFNIGYHETITRAYLRLVEARRPRESIDFVKFKAGNLDLFQPSLRSLYTYYSKAQLWSPEAKSIFVQPDLKPLP